MEIVPWKQALMQLPTIYMRSQENVAKQANFATFSLARCLKLKNKIGVRHRIKMVSFFWYRHITSTSTSVLEIRQMSDSNKQMPISTVCDRCTYNQGNRRVINLWFCDTRFFYNTYWLSWRLDHINFDHYRGATIFWSFQKFIIISSQESTY